MIQTLMEVFATCHGNMDSKAIISIWGGDGQVIRARETCLVQITFKLREQLKLSLRSIEKKTKQTQILFLRTLSSLVWAQIRNGAAKEHWKV